MASDLYQIEPKEHENMKKYQQVWDILVAWNFNLPLSMDIFGS